MDELAEMLLGAEVITFDNHAQHKILYIVRKWPVKLSHLNEACSEYATPLCTLQYALKDLGNCE